MVNRDTGCSQKQAALSPPLPLIKHMSRKIKTTGGAVGLTENPVALR